MLGWIHEREVVLLALEHRGAARGHEGKARPAGHDAEARIDQDLPHVLVAGREPRLGAVPETDADQRLLIAKSSVLRRGVDRAHALHGIDRRLRRGWLVG